MRRRTVLALLASSALAGCSFGAQDVSDDHTTPTAGTQTTPRSDEHTTPTGTEQPKPTGTDRSTATPQADPTPEMESTEITSQTPQAETPTPTPTSSPTLTVTRRYVFGEYHRDENPFGFGGTLEFTVMGFELRTHHQIAANETTPTPGNEQVLTGTVKVRNPLDRGYQDVCPRDPSLFAAIVDGTIYQDKSYDYSCATTSHGLLVAPGETQTLDVRTGLPDSVGRADVEIAFDGKPDDTKLYPIRWA